MFRLFAAGTTLALVLITSLALGDDKNPPAAGRKGTITAWDESNTTVLEHRFCIRTRYSWDYAACGSRMREALKRHVCTLRGPGTYKYLVQIGDGRPYPSTLQCR